MNRDVYVKPPKKAKCQSSKLLKLNTAIYGLSDTLRSWLVFKC